jgi:hypothetical protein
MDEGFRRSDAYDYADLEPLTWANGWKPTVVGPANRCWTFRYRVLARANGVRPRRDIPVNIPALSFVGYQSQKEREAVKLFVAWTAERQGVILFIGDPLGSRPPP